MSRMVKLLPLELGEFDECDPGDMWTSVVMEKNLPLCPLPGLLFLINLRRLWSVSQYTLELMVLLCSRNLISSVKWIALFIKASALTYACGHPGKLRSTPWIFRYVLL
ncbi:hypothetical protein TNIN_471151 [Trichonephila inaurata madagascariensis]|uniref:Uncharacterized protein n=1 Tax=Trichonephila inaurata madagascariensis TaxID=2747483 RepID=A0A8X6Y859_9ARAC|nr:hypothetical protein TNIN_471151 [Trichonephila inaurata madagascariensis]